MPHATTTHLLTIQAPQATKSGFLSLPLLPPLVLNRMFLWYPILLPGSPLPKDPHAGITKETQPILNSLPTHTSSTVPTPSTSPILLESAESWSSFSIFSTRQIHGNKRMNLTSLYRSRASAVGVRCHSHQTTIFSCISYKIWKLIDSHYHSLGLLPYLSARLTGQMHLPNCQVANCESWMVRCSPRATGFSREQFAIFFSICNQIINFHAVFWERFLRCGRVTMNE